jgi:hypothetical protein
MRPAASQPRTAVGVTPHPLRRRANRDQRFAPCLNRLIMTVCVNRRPIIARHVAGWTSWALR